MKPKAAFDATMQRVDRLLNLYDLLYNQRQRGTRQDWALKFNKLMHWPITEKIQRIDGNNALLVLRKNALVGINEFRHDELSELLRAAIVVSVSALDRYCHEVLLSRIIDQMDRSEVNWPAELKKLSLPLIFVKRSVKNAKLRKGIGGKVRTRPMNIVKQGLQEKFHKDLTLQRPDDIATAWSMIGIKSLWSRCGKSMNVRAEEIKENLNRIIKRRNEIAHEGDIARVRNSGKIVVNPIENDAVCLDIKWLKKLVNAMDKNLKKRLGEIP